MSLRDLVEGEAMLDDEENDGEVSDNYDEDRRDGPSTERHYDDSSEEDEDEDDDEDAARAVSIACGSRLVILGATNLWSTKYRFAKVSSSTKMKRSRSARSAGRRRNGHVLAKRNTLMRKIWN